MPRIFTICARLPRADSKMYLLNDVIIEHWHFFRTCSWFAPVGDESVNLSGEPKSVGKEPHERRRHVTGGKSRGSGGRRDFRMMPRCSRWTIGICISSSPRPSFGPHISAKDYRAKRHLGKRFNAPCHAEKTCTALRGVEAGLLFCCTWVGSWSDGLHTTNGPHHSSLVTTSVLVRVTLCTHKFDWADLNDACVKTDFLL